MPQSRKRPPRTLIARNRLQPNKPLALAVVVVVTAVGLATLAHSFASTVYTSSRWDSSLDRTIHSDDTQSVTLPNGKVVWVFGDTIQINGKSTVGPYGYPHDAMVTQAPGTENFAAVPGSYGFGWQHVPNWADGSYFWMSTPIVDHGKLYVLGSRIKGAGSFSVLGQYVAVFDAGTLAFQSIAKVPAGATGKTNWGGVYKGKYGWWLTGTHGVTCSYATDCKVGDLAWVPFGKLTTPSKWQIHNDVIPATANIGTTLGIVKSPGGWDIFTKTGDAYGGSTIERLTATSITGHWTVNGTWPVTPPPGAVSYGVAVHPEQTAPVGQVLVSYNINDSKSLCQPQFIYLPK